MSKTVRILGLDPAFRNFGWAQVEYTPGKPEIVIDMGVIVTKKADVKRKIRDADDLFISAQEIIRGLDAVVPWAQVIVSEESVLGFKGKRASKLAGMAWMAYAAISEIYETPTVSVPIVDIKKKIGGHAKASKEEIKEAINAHFGEDLGDKFLKPKKLAGGLWEHAYDATAAVLCSETSDVIRMATQE